MENDLSLPWKQKAMGNNYEKSYKFAKTQQPRREMAAVQSDV